MAELVRLQICREINDTWAWVALGPERQPDVMAGAPGVAQDAPIIDEDGQVDPAPVQAPPPSAPARTMPQRMARLEEDVFYTWTTTSLARMMDMVGVSYTSYSQIPREYQRRTRQRTGEASTSAAQQDQQQPDL
ncbi:hypothetical protein Tco_0061109 [Tanacetum coccineum]